MRSDLQKLQGISEIKTDIPSRSATFKIAQNQADLKTKLDEFAKTNEHMKDWSFAEASSKEGEKKGGESKGE